MSLNLDKSTWKRVRLGDVIVRSRKQVDPTDGSVDRYVAGGHFDSGSPTVERWGDVNDGQMGSTFRYAFQPGQVLFVSARPYLRKAAVAQFEGVVADKTYVLDALPENGILQEFLPFVLLSESFCDFAVAEATGSMNPRLLWGAMQRFEFGLPPLDEQRRIADLMWAVERERRAAEKLVNAGESLMRLVRRNLMSVGDALRAVDIFDIEIGRQRSPKFQTGSNPVPYLRSANVKPGLIVVDDVLSMDFTQDEVMRFALEPGDVLVTEGCGSPLEIGAPAQWNAELDGPVCFQNTLLRYRAKKVDQNWLWQWCQYAFDTGLFRDAAAGTGILHIGLKRAKEMMVRIPSEDLRREAVERLKALDESLRAPRTRATSAKALLPAISASIFGGAA